MRFYFGFSKRIKLKWIITALLGLLAFFGIYTKAHAEEVPSFYEINTSTFESIDNCNYWFAPQNSFNNDFLGGNLSNAPWISTHNLYDDLVFNTEYSNVLIHQNANNSAYIDIKYHISTDIEHLYFSAKNYYNSYASDRDRPNGASWLICSDATCGTTYDNTITRTVAQDNVYYPNYYINVELPLSRNNTRYEYFILRLRGSYYGTSTNDKMYWTRVILQNSLITFDTNNDTTLENNNGNYCDINTTPVLDESTQAIIDSIEQGLSQDTLNNANDFFGGNLSEVDPSLPTFNDTHGLQSIILAPVNLLRGIMNANTSCSNTLDLSINIPSLTTHSSYTRNISIPNGCILWNNVPNLVVASYQVIIFGLWGYFVLVDLVHLVDNLLDPERKNEFTLDL